MIISGALSLIVLTLLVALAFKMRRWEWNVHRDTTNLRNEILLIEVKSLFPIERYLTGRNKLPRYSSTSLGSNSRWTALAFCFIVSVAQERLRGALPGFARKGGFSNAMIAHRSRQTFPSASQRHTLDMLAVGAGW